MEVAYTNHIGRSTRDTHTGKNTAISSIADLVATEKHNNHDYTQIDVDHMQSAIDLDHKHLNRQYEVINGELVEVKGHLDLAQNVRKIYDEQFADAVVEYNQRQIAAGHPERQIDSYIDKISGDKQQEVAVEGLLQIGSLDDWEGRSIEDRLKAGPILLHGLKRTLAELNGPDREFVIAGASLHLNEGSPHLHYVGVPVQETPNAKNGMKKRVKKAAVFTKDTMGTGLQDNVRAELAPMIKETYGWDFEKKRTGRNEDLSKNRYVNEKLQEQIQEQEQRLNDIELTIYEAMDNVERGLRDIANESVAVVADDKNGAYDDAMFLLEACSDERFKELSQEGNELKKEVLGNFTPGLQKEESLDERICNIANGKYKPRELSWAEQQRRMADYKTVSDAYWDMRRIVLDEYDMGIKNKYSERKQLQISHNNAMRMLHHSRGLITTIIATAWALSSLKKERLINQQIAEIRKQRSIVIKNTTDFATFSKAYREDLKAGKMPCDDYMIAMTNAVITLDGAFNDFLDKNKTKNPRRTGPDSR